MTVALVIHHAERMRRIVVSPVFCPILPYFYTLCHKWHDFGEELLNIKCVFLLSLKLLSKIFLILERIKRNFDINVHTSSYKVPVILVRF